MRYILSFRGFLALLGFLGLLIYGLVPSPIQQETLFPSPALSQQAPFAYDDSAQGGTSRAYQSYTDSLVSFDCILGADTSFSAFCAFGWDLKPSGVRNWSTMDSLVFHIKARGTDQIIVKVLTHDPNHPQTPRLLLKEVPVSPQWQKISVPLIDFYTPHYWYQEHQLDSTRITPHWESVLQLEVGPDWSAPRSQPLNIQIRSIHVQGKSNFYFGILVVWELLLIIMAMGVRTRSRSRS